MGSQLYRLGGNDLVKGAITALFAAIVVTLGSVVNQTGFDVFSVDWGSVANLVVKSALSAFIGYLGKNILTDEGGKFLGKI